MAWMGVLCMTVISLGLASGGAVAEAHSTERPLLQRINVATVGVPDVDEFMAWYGEWLGLILREQGQIPDAAAESWGTPAMAGRRYALMSPPGHPDVFVRAVEVAARPEYRPATTFGWNAFEMIVDDVNAMRQRLERSPFTIIGEPRPLNSRPTIHAMQVTGPGGEILYLTTETGDRVTSTLPMPVGDLGRLFIVVLGGPDIVALRDFYADRFRLEPNPIRVSRGQTVQRAWGGTESGTHPITLIRFAEHGNSIELNGYVKPGLTARPREDGALPQGNAMVTLSVPDLDALDVQYVSPPRRLPGLAYGGRRSAVFIGPAGELTELLEEPDR
jgi:catechol 2,3-dioxygenase-like lactoylglutathione lyase family enzyme